MTHWNQQAQKNNAYFRGIDGESFPEAIRRLLMEASLLYHVPFGYLLPNGEILAEESLRFFCIDHNWTLAYMDGIMSIGRSASIDYSHDTCFLVSQYKKALQENEAVRLRLQGKEESFGGEAAFSVVSGFLLRSVLAEDFRGLEFRAYGGREGGESARLAALRIEKLGPEILLGIFRGEVKRLEIAQPPEGLHFGFGKSGAGYKKTLRSLTDGALGDQSVEISMRNGAASRVINVKETAARIQSALGEELKNQGTAGKVTSAEFALEMIQNAHTGVFKME